MKKLLTTLLLAFLPARAIAQGNLDKLDQALRQATATSDNEQLPNQIYNAVAVFLRDRVLSVLIAGAIAIAVIYLMYGSLQYFTAYGDENRATNAKKTITYAFIGLVISFMAMGIAGFVQQSVTNSQIFNPSAAEAPVK